MPVKSKMEIFQNYVAFSEYMNFKKHKEKSSKIDVFSTFFWIEFWRRGGYK